MTTAQNHPAIRLSAVTIDCTDPQRVARFWAELLGGVLSVPLPGWLRLTLTGGPPVQLNFQPVPEAKSAKVRLHLDLTVDAVDPAVQRVSALGGRWTGERHDYEEGAVLVMADPEGHEFCITEYHGSTGSNGSTG